MKHPSVLEAFELLISELESVLKETRQAVASASQQGRYNEAKARLNESQEIEKFIAEIRTKMREWTALGKKSQGKRVRNSPRLPRGRRTPEKEYRLPILRALVALGGEAKANDVLDLVYREMKPRFKPEDLKPLPSDKNTPRWRNTAQWARQSMIEEGLLRNDSPRGIWAITEKGRKYLAEHGG